MNIRPETPVEAVPVAPPPAMNPRTRALLQGPIVPMLLRMAWPNVLIMFAQAATGLPIAAPDYAMVPGPAANARIRKRYARRKVEAGAA